jgi:hypothetical protein
MPHVPKKYKASLYSPKDWPYHVIVVRIGTAHQMEKDSKSLAKPKGITHYEFTHQGLLFSDAEQSAKALKLGRALFTTTVGANTALAAQIVFGEYLQKRKK